MTFGYWKRKLWKKADSQKMKHAFEQAEEGIVNEMLSVNFVQNGWRA